MSEGFPIVRRFVIKRHPITFSTKLPWVVRDRTRPAFLGHHATFEAAIAAVDKKLAEETGIPTRREIREAMDRHVNAPCSVEPIVTEPTA